MHNLIGGYKPDRKWELTLGPRAGGWWDIGSSKGCPLLGVGIMNTYRLSDKWSLFVDAGYHFVASINGTHSGSGHGGNSFAEINIGVQYDLKRKSENDRWKRTSETSRNEKRATLNHFWDNWFVQAGAGLSLIKPYGTSISDIFPNGSTVGVNLSIGKWFTPEAGVRGGLNWQNGLIPNKNATFLDSEDGLKKNYKEHGFLSLYADFLLNLHHIFGGYDSARRWNAIVYPRMGLAMNFSSSNKESSVLGIGTEQTLKINDRVKLFADVSYQVTTSGFLDGKFYTGEDNGLSSNGWLDINIGVQYELGQTIGWDRPGSKEARNYGYTDGHNWPRFVVNTGASVVVAFGAKTVLKKAIKEERPDHSDNKSFPSGHSAIAFAAARSLDKEFRRNSIWIPIAGYAAATAVGIERIASNRHHWYDVVAGAGLGFGAAELAWWLSDVMFGKGRNIAVGSSGNTVDVAINW